MHEQIEPQNAAQRIARGEAVALDLMPESVFAHAHARGAVNACVYEVAFNGRVATLIPNRSAQVILIDADGEARAAEMAAEKMRRMGYANVCRLRGGFAAWREAGLPVDGTGASPAPPRPRSGTRELDLARSRIQWAGRNLANGHHGTLRFREGRLVFHQDRLTGGEAVVDMDSIACDDIADAALNRVLIDHLKSDDFFDVALHPIARCSFTELIYSPATPRGRPNVQGQADLTIKGITHAITFDAISAASADDRWVLHGHFDIDRTRWQVAYASGKWFRHLGMHLVDDLISLDVLLVSAE